MNKDCLEIDLRKLAGRIADLTGNGLSPESRREGVMKDSTARFRFQRLVVGDLERQAQFYRSTLGLGTSNRLPGAINGRPMEEVIFSAAEGGIEFVLLPFPDEPPPAPPSP